MIWIWEYIQWSIQNKLFLFASLIIVFLSWFSFACYKPIFLMAKQCCLYSIFMFRKWEAVITSRFWTYLRLFFFFPIFYKISYCAYKEFVCIHGLVGAFITHLHHSFQKLLVTLNIGNSLIAQGKLVLYVSDITCKFNSTTHYSLS